MTCEPAHNSFRASLAPDRNLLLVKAKQSHEVAKSLTGASVPRSETRHVNSRDADRHRLADAQALIRKGTRTYTIDVINISGGGAMVEGAFAAKLWQSVTLILGDIGEVECAVRWIRDNRCGLEFAHETKIECDAAVLNEMLRKVITDSVPEEEEEDQCPTLVSSPAEETGGGKEARREPHRHPLIWSGIIQFNHEEVVARLRNISAWGAQVETSVGFAAGSEILLDLGKAGQIPATVRWSRGDQSGLAFHREFDIRSLSMVRPKIAGSSWVKPEYLADEDAHTSPWASQWGRLTIQELKRTLFR